MINLRNTLSVLTLAAATTMAALPASAQVYVRGSVGVRPVAVPVAQPVYLVPQRRHTVDFVQQTRAQINQVGNQLQNQVSRGVVAPEAISRFNADRDRVEITLRRFESDGVITGREERRINVQIGSMSRIDEQYRIRRMRRRF